MQPLTQSLDTRRLSMLKAMGVELWWAKAPKVAAGAAAALPAVVPTHTAGSAPAAVVSPQQAAQLVRDSAAPMASPAAPVQPSPTAAPSAQVVAEPVVQRVAEPVRPAATAGASAPAVVWSTPSQWQTRQGQEPSAAASAPASQTAGLLLLVDDLQALGDAQAAAMQLLENMVRAMGLAHNPALWLSWAKRAPQELGTEAAAGQALPAASAQQLVADASPRAVLVMGRDAAQHWLGSSEPLGALRQANHQAHGVPVVVTYSPAYLLRATHAKRQAWADLQRVMALLATTAGS